MKDNNIYTGYIILNKTKKKDPDVYQYPFGFSGENIYLAQIHTEEQLRVIDKTRVFGIKKVKYRWDRGSHEILV